MESGPLVGALNAPFHQNKYEPFIRHIRFPVFKNLSPNLEITFDYPVTAIIGANGTNKSSILRALESCPDGTDISDHWFETALDPTPFGNGSSRYIHGFRLPSGNVAEVIKQRVFKKSRGLDYFETTRPRKRDGMKSMPSPIPKEDSPYGATQRWSPIKKNVVYLDFREELPAYDIRMRFNWRGQPNDKTTKKSDIRRYSKKIAETLTQLDSSKTFRGKDRLLSPAEALTPEEIEQVSIILGQEYTNIRLVKHDWFKVEGYTATLSTNQRAYSEAYAGSGEFAVVMLVHKVMKALPRSLILLDEPETSLHPAAQRELTRFLLSQSAKHGHQVVMTTHAPAIVEELPDCARKTLAVNSISGEVVVASQAATLDSAFNRLGASFQQKTILVEDKLAQEMVLRTIRVFYPDSIETFQIVPTPGGVKTLINGFAVPAALSGIPLFIVLDGDQMPTDPANLENSTDQSLDGVLETYGISLGKIPKNSNEPADNSEVINRKNKIATFFRTNVRYLPDRTDPDKLLLLEIYPDTPADLTKAQAKRQWAQITQQRLGLTEKEHVKSREILEEQKRALATLDANSNLLQKISNLLKDFLH